MICLLLDVSMFKYCLNIYTDFSLSCIVNLSDDPPIDDQRLCFVLHIGDSLYEMIDEFIINEKCASAELISKIGLLEFGVSANQNKTFYTV
jgi:hypothetical protein